MQTIPTKESLTVEFKSAPQSGSLRDRSRLSDRELIETAVCLANTDGGEIYLGVEDDGRITGLHPQHQNLSTLAAMIANRTNPPLSVRVTSITEASHTIARIEVPKSPRLVATSDGLLQRRRLQADGTPQCVPFYPYIGFLSSQQWDEKITHKGAMGELSLLFQTELELPAQAGEALDAYRGRLARHLLTTDLIAHLGDSLPSQLSTLPLPSKPSTRNTCLHLATTWRLRRDLRESYIHYANQIEKELGLAHLTFSLDQMAQIETFLAIERALQQCIESALRETPTPSALRETPTSSTFRETPTPELIAIARERKSSFWSEYQDVQAHWALIEVTGRLLLEANSIEQALKTSPQDFQALFQAYRTHLGSFWEKVIL
jgi:hypothetical protein